MYDDNEEIRTWVASWLSTPRRSDIRAADVHEAVSIAEAHRAAGKSDWYRGQPGLWPLITTLGRLGKADRESAIQAMKRFSAWIEQSPGLGVQSGDQAIAIAQHYGLATPFLDFTASPKVAAFFATNSPTLKVGDECCLLCFHRQEFVSYFRTHRKIRPEDQVPEAIEIDVPDLWRLHSQQGGFLFLPMAGIERVWPPDRIVFPYTEQYDGISPSIVYPDRKSGLEIRIDGFILNERTLAGAAEVKDFVASIGQEITYTDSKPFLEDYLDVERLLAKEWTPTIDAEWFATPPENFFDVSHDAKATVRLPTQLDLPSCAALFANAIVHLESNGAKPRGTPLSWVIEGGDVRYGARIDDAQRALNRVWDGMRGLPYDDSEVARAMAMCLLVALHWNSDQNCGRDVDSIAPYIDDPLRVELADSVGGYCTAYVSRGNLRAAVRADFADVLKPEQRAVAEDIENIVQIVRSAPLLYDFDALRELFVESLIATQCVVKPEDAPIFSPALCRTLGLP